MTPSEEESKTLRFFFWVISFIPLLGALTYLCLRSSLAHESDLSICAK